MKNKILLFFIIVLFLLIIICLWRVYNLKNIFKDNIYYKEENYNRYELYKKLNKEKNIENIIKEVNLNLDYNFYENTMDALNKDTNLVLVNKHYFLNKDDIPNDLVKFDYKFTSGIDVLIKSEVKDMFEKMSIDASLLGLCIKAISGYRSYEYQKKLYEDYLKDDPVNVVDTYSARPGYSEHQTGLAIDVYNEDDSYTDFGDTDEFKWLKDNAHNYGFIIRYTNENSYITGYKSEPWHIRYVGYDVSKYIYENNISFEEYILNKK